MSYLTSNVYNSKAIPSLISAVFIDLMTVLLPLLLELPKRCILYVRSRKNLIYEEEDIIEKLLESIAPWDKKFINNVQSLKDLLSRFNDLFNITNGESFEKGFSLRCEEKELYNFVKNNPTMKSFIIFIKTCNYLYYD